MSTPSFQACAAFFPGLPQLSFQVRAAFFFFCGFLSIFVLMRLQSDTFSAESPHA
jgi:hypothetical protein